jgi:hypothetical protein
MPTLADSLTHPSKRSTVIQDLVQLVDREVAKKGGLSGMGIKTAYMLVKAVKPSFVRDAIDGMLDECVQKLEPLYAEAAQAGGSVSARLNARAGAVADALLSVSDARAEHTSHGSVKKAYAKLRPTAKRNVEEAVPGLVALVEKHAAK